MTEDSSSIVVAGTAGEKVPVSRGRRAKQRAGTRDALIWCGTEIFSERGFQVTGIEEVLKRVGVPKGSFYHFFSSKRDFGDAVIDNYARYFEKRLDSILGDKSLAPLDRLRAFIERGKKGMEKYDFRRGCLVGNLGQEVSGLEDPVRLQLESVLQSWQKRTAACLREAVAAGEIASDSDVEALAEFFWIGWEGAILRAKLTRNAEPIDRFATLFFVKVAK